MLNILNIVIKTDCSNVTISCELRRWNNCDSYIITQYGEYLDNLLQNVNVTYP
jgi:hypothetical protein